MICLDIYHDVNTLLMKATWSPLDHFMSSFLKLHGDFG